MTLKIELEAGASNGITLAKLPKGWNRADPCAKDADRVEQSTSKETRDAELFTKASTLFGSLLGTASRLDRLAISTSRQLFGLVLNGVMLLRAYNQKFWQSLVKDESGDVPGWVLVVLMTTGLVTAIWTIAAPRLSTILRSSLDSMNNVR